MVLIYLSKSKKSSSIESIYVMNSSNFDDNYYSVIKIDAAK